MRLFIWKTQTHSSLSNTSSVFSNILLIKVHSKCGPRLHHICVMNVSLQDTEFPGVVARPIGEFRSNADYQYQLLRCNVDLLKIIQLGLTFMNEKGEYPPGTSTWQFNFKFNLT